MRGTLGRGRRARVRLFCPLNDTQGWGPAAEESRGGGGGSPSAVAERVSGWVGVGKKG